jgi:type VII secretion-associated serine protease mycosin
VVRRGLGRAAAIAAVLALLGTTPAAAADSSGAGAASGNCPSPAPDVAQEPWSLQRVMLDQLWPKNAQGQVQDGTGVTVAVIDTGVDPNNPQLAGKDSKVFAGHSYLMDKSQNPPKPVDGTSYDDTVGHGTKVAGIIAASHRDKVGFVGLAPGAKILSIRQNDDAGDGDVQSLIDAINEVVKDDQIKDYKDSQGNVIPHDIRVINISQDVRTADASADFGGSDALKQAVDAAEKAGIVVVAASGNDGVEETTYPAAYPTVLSVGASDRNNERAGFSTYGDWVKVAAPGVDMLSTVPKGGQCVDNGTSFATPYVAGLAALLAGAHPDWSPAQIRTRIEQTAQRTQRGRNKYIGWGVVDPVKAVTDPTTPGAAPTEDPQVRLDTAPILPQPLGLGETQADRDRRTATYVLGTAVLSVALLFGGSVVLRDLRRRRAAR